MRRKKGLLNCNVGKGMFQGEIIVSFTVKGNTISAIVDKEHIKRGELEVDIFGKKGDELLIGIPGESFSSSRKIWVPEQMVMSS